MASNLDSLDVEDEDDAAELLASSAWLGGVCSDGVMHWSSGCNDVFGLLFGRWQRRARGGWKRQLGATDRGRLRSPDA